VATLNSRLDKLEETFIYDRAIDRTMYESQRDRLNRRNMPSVQPVTGSEERG